MATLISLTATGPLFVDGEAWHEPLRKQLGHVHAVTAQQVVGERLGHALWCFREVRVLLRVEAESLQEIANRARRGCSVDGHDAGSS